MDSQAPLSGGELGNSPRSEPRPGLLLVTFTVLAVLLGTFGAVASAGIWDPPELETAELARRIAHGLLGAEELAGAPEEGVPTRGELGRGELPFTSIAVGFRTLGLSASAGRLPLCIWALFGFAALHFLVRRLASARAAWLSVLALATMPLYFLHARTMLGDIVTMAGSSAAMAGLAIAIFDCRDRRVRIAAVSLAISGFVAGFFARGLVLGVAVPALGVGLAWLSLALSASSTDRAGARLGAGVLLLGILTLAYGVVETFAIPPDVYSMLVGSATLDARTRPTFDVVIRDLGHAVFPWSAVVPLAAGRLLSDPNASSDAARSRERALRLVAISTAGVALFVHSALSSELGSIPYSTPAALAVIPALALIEFERGAPPSRAFGLGVGALAVLLLIDFRNFPEKGLVPFGVEGAVFPESFASTGIRWLALGTVGAAGAFFLMVQEADAARNQSFAKESYLTWLRVLRNQWSGNLWFALIVIASALLGFEVLALASDRLFHFPALEALGELPRLGVRAGWMLLLGLVLLPLTVLALRDSSRWLLALGARIPFARRDATSGGAFRRGAAALVVVSVCGVVSSLGYYPALMRQISPQHAFEAYRNRAEKNQPLGLVGLDARVARYQAGGRVHELRDLDVALDWLTQPIERRFLALRATDLAALNAGYRALVTPRTNLPILEAKSSEVLLAANRLGSDETNQNPLTRFVLDRAPKPSRPLDVDLGGKLRVLGWDLRTKSGEVAEAAVAGSEYEFIIYYRVDERLGGEWDTFIHIDGLQRRYNGDHPTLLGKYPFVLWLVGDYIADRYPIRLEPYFAPGLYDVYFGLYSGTRRLEVRRGRHEDDRIVGGKLEVR
jgi:hypothetical protein